MTVDKNAVGSRIKTIRQSKGLTLESFGEFIDGASKGLVGNWEKGVNLPNNKRLKMIAQFGNITVNELLYGSLFEIVTKYTDEIMMREIKERQSKKYKLLYEPTFKKQTVEYLVNHYNFENLTDVGIKQYTMQLLEKYLDKKQLESKYHPYSDKHALDLTDDLLTNLIKNQIDSYFKDENIKTNNLGYLQSDEIKENLSYELYKKIRIVLENAQNEIREIDNEEI